ncbi:hypothetical protein BC941DRAFT_508379 [Chlamydoabsidia padenii]|nr:hypothetical protein BC941DRAFT_508379 [Chlamydoabsidia padenii]
MSPSLTTEPTLVPEGEDDLQVQKWLKELDNAEQLMDKLEAKTEKLDAKMDALLSSLNDMNKPANDLTNATPVNEPTTEQQNDKQYKMATIFTTPKIQQLDFCVLFTLAPASKTTRIWR